MKGAGADVYGLIAQFADRRRQTYCYDTPLSSRKPTYTSLRPASERFSAAGPYAEDILDALVTNMASDGCVTIDLTLLALSLGIAGNRANRLMLWQTIERLACYRLLSIESSNSGDPCGSYRAPLVILEADVATEVSGHILTDVHEVALIVNRAVLEDRQPLPITALAGVS